jgi:energy-coupling factor transporter ATP-binding protein EcfA2
VENPSILVRNLDYIYPNGFQALKNINLTVGQNEIVGIIGQNGAGKSTFLKNLTGLLKPTKGEVIIDGVTTGAISIARLATKIGFVLQNPDRQLFANTVEEEVSYGPKNLRLSEEEVQQRVQEALEFVELQDKAKEYPPAMSKGERAKVILASVLAMKPRIIVLDEPTTGQDFKGCHQIMRLARHFYEQGHTVLVVTHHMSLVTDYCKRVVVFCQGEILADGSTDEVFKQEELLKTTFIMPPQITLLGNRIKDKLHTDKTFTKVSELGDAVLNVKQLRV